MINSSLLYHSRFNHFHNSFFSVLTLLHHFRKRTSSSSNYSFREYATNHIQLFGSNDNTPETLPNGTLQWKDKDFLLPHRTSLSSSSSYEFSECTFTYFYINPSGGVIIRCDSYSSLSVAKSTFTSCTVSISSTSNCKRAIRCSPCYSVTISSSLFIACEAYRGGGVYLEGLTHSCSVNQCVFMHSVKRRTMEIPFYYENFPL